MGEENKSQRGCLGNYREVTKLHLQPDPSFHSCNAFPHLALLLVSSPQVSETGGHRQSPPMPTMCFPVSGSGTQALFYPLARWWFLLTQSKGLTETTASMSTIADIAEILLLGFVQRANLGGSGGLPACRVTYKPSRDPALVFTEVAVPIWGAHGEHRSCWREVHLKAGEAGKLPLLLEPH